MALSLATASLSFSAPSLSIASAPRALVVAQEGQVGFQDPSAVEKAAEAAAKKGEFCYGLPGSVAPFEKFDPFNFLDGKTFEQVRTWREAELAHCRVGMLAAAGFLVQEKFHPLFNGGCEALRIPVGWSDPSEPEHVFQKLKPEYVPGDIGFDPLGFKPTDPVAFMEMQTK